MQLLWNLCRHGRIMQRSLIRHSYWQTAQTPSIGLVTQHLGRRYSLFRANQGRDLSYSLQIGQGGCENQLKPKPPSSYNCLNTSCQNQMLCQSQSSELWSNSESFSLGPWRRELQIKLGTKFLNRSRKEGFEGGTYRLGLILEKVLYIWIVRSFQQFGMFAITVCLRQHQFSTGRKYFQMPRLSARFNTLFIAIFEIQRPQNFLPFPAPFPLTLPASLATIVKTNSIDINQFSLGLSTRRPSPSTHSLILCKKVGFCSSLMYMHFLRAPRRMQVDMK